MASPSDDGDQDVAAALARIVGESFVLTDPDLRAPYEVDWTRRFQGSARLVVRPRDTAEVARVLRCCHDAGVPVITQGGNTGLVGGGIPAHGEVVVSLTRLDDLDGVDTLAGQVSAGAGVTLARLQEHAAASGLHFPVDLAARDSATIGGMIATNAGGIRVLRYGSMRAQVLGVEAVTADGRVLTRMDGLVKDNAGYDLAGLLTGSEGTLAVITRARLRLVQRLEHRVVTVVALDSLEAAQDTLQRVRATAPSLEAAEVFFADGLDLVLQHTSATAPFAETHPVYLLLECAARQDPTGELAAALEDREGLLDVAVGTDAPSRARLWHLREAHTEAINAVGVPIKLDICLPSARIGAFLARLDDVVAAVEPSARSIVFGHLGDGNLHINVLEADPTEHDLEEAVLRLTTELGGSISAEHGIGRAKAAWLHLQRDATDVAIMGSIKRAFDPENRLNPGVLFPTH
ncbi:MAG: FAD-binding oxidoreductase [Intrasporangiaceae bacterium]|nr:FAD-binding oxidoreductase [Intrasporangiaceae bacterium]